MRFSSIWGIAIFCSILTIEEKHYYKIHCDVKKSELLLYGLLKLYLLNMNKTILVNTSIFCMIIQSIWKSKRIIPLFPYRPEREGMYLYIDMNRYCSYQNVIHSFIIVLYGDGLCRLYILIIAVHWKRKTWKMYLRTSVRTFMWSGIWKRIFGIYVLRVKCSMCMKSVDTWK